MMESQEKGRKQGGTEKREIWREERGVWESTER